VVKTDTIEGTVDQSMTYHYDMVNDVLYLRLLSEQEAETVSEETPDGFLLLRRVDDDAPVGLTIVNWWKRFGTGPLPDSLSQLESAIEPWTKQFVA